jgi:hypothetical protein
VIIRDGNITTYPSNHVAEYPFVIKNNSNSSIGAYQQMVVLNFSMSATKLGLRSDMANVKWFDSSGRAIPSWLESYTSTGAIYWLYISGDIPANSSITVYYGIASTDTILMNGTDTGEAPQLSSTYGEYDNGVNVFTNYWNFAGTSTPSGINVYTSDGSITFNNGVTIKGGASTSGGENGVATSTSFSQPIIVDYYGTQSTSPSGDSWGGNISGFSNYLSNSDSTPFSGGTYTLIDFEGSPEGKSTSTPNANPFTNQSGTITGGTLSTPSSNLFPNSIWTHIYTSSTYYTYQNYVNSTGYITGASNTASLPFAIIVENNEASYVPNGMTVNWLRTRTYVPEMPSVSTNGVSNIVYYQDQTD